MARPEYVARIHAAKYDLRSCDGSQKDHYLAVYRRALEEGAAEAGTTTVQLAAAIARDFGKWMAQEKLPKLPPPAGGEPRA